MLNNTLVQKLMQLYYSRYLYLCNSLKVPPSLQWLEGDRLVTGGPFPYHYFLLSSFFFSELYNSAHLSEY